MAAHRRGVSMPNQLTDRDAAARSGINPPRDHDHGEKYDGHDALFPEGWDDMDPGRFD